MDTPSIAWSSLHLSVANNNDNSLSSLKASPPKAQPPPIEAPLDGTVDYLVAQNHSLQQQLGEKTLAHHQLLLQHSQLQSEFTRAESEIVQALDAVQSLESPHSQLRALREKYAAKVGEAEREQELRRKLAETCAELQGDRDALQQALQATQLEMERSAREMRSAHQQALDERQKLWDLCKEELAQARKLLERLDMDRQSAMSEGNKLRLAVEQERDAWKETCARQDEQLANLRAELESVKVRHVELLQEHAVADCERKEAVSLRKQVLELGEDLARARRKPETTVASCQVSIGDMKTDLFRQHLADTRHAYQTMQQAYKTVTERCALLEQQVQHLTRENRILAQSGLPLERILPKAKRTRSPAARKDVALQESASCLLSELFANNNQSQSESQSESVQIHLSPTPHLPAVNFRKHQPSQQQQQQPEEAPTLLHQLDDRIHTLESKLLQEYEKESSGASLDALHKVIQEAILEEEEAEKENQSVVALHRQLDDRIFQFDEQVESRE